MVRQKERLRDNFCKIIIQGGFPVTLDDLREFEEEYKTITKLSVAEQMKIIEMLTKEIINIKSSLHAPHDSVICLRTKEGWAIYLPHQKSLKLLEGF